MGGKMMTSILDVTTRDQQYVYSRSKMEIALEDTLQHSGQILSLVIKVGKILSCLTYLSADTFQEKQKE